ncbi:MAG: SDR family NAD(P)-dependent oxidoreductase [Actinobacteria bacterium]|nr:MAG: SDR family NAD(P)-dependent oxidoreductase [Actinomycetota bacterium]
MHTHVTAARDLSGRTVAVTGAGRGIGRATATALARAGARVALGDVDADAALRAAGELGDGALGLPLDVTDEESFGDFLDAATELGPLYGLVNNAGVMQIGPFAKETAATARRMIDINAEGVARGMRLAAPGFLERGSGHLVNVASTAFVLGLSQAVHAELRGTGVELSCVLPGFVRTELTSGVKRPGYVREVEPEDIAEAIVGALHRPRLQVWVPRSLGPVTYVNSLLPRAVREGAARILGADRVFLDFDVAARAGYEERVSR